MAENDRIRARNKRWLRMLAEGEITVDEICLDEDVCARTVRRGVADARRYPEMARYVEWLQRVRETSAA